MNSLYDALRGPKPPRPDNATTIYTVKWFLASDQFGSDYGARIGSTSTPTRLHSHKIFVTKEKAEALKRDIEEAFKTLGYMIEGRVTIEEDWYE